MSSTYLVRMERKGRVRWGGRNEKGQNRFACLRGLTVLPRCSGITEC